MIVKARFVVPVDAPPIENGAIQFEGGTIVAVGRAAEFPSQGAVDYGDAAILPGFVNAHTHLELSLLADRVPPSSDFVDWLHRLIAARTSDVQSNLSDVGDYVGRAVQTGIDQSLSAGVTTIGDITSYPIYSRPVLAASPLRAVSFGEVIAMGKGRDLLEGRLNAATEERDATHRVHVGISPHAHYTVEPGALRTCARQASDRALPLCVHVAETREEETFVRQGEGPFVTFLQELGLWDESIASSNCSPVELLAKIGLLGPRTLLAHANYVSDSDIALIAESGASVAYCPGTHAAFGHPPHRFRDMLRAGVNVCLGTDSLASNPSLSILDELRFLRAGFHDLSPDELLWMATLRGAKALGLSQLFGSLTPGKSADFVAMELPPTAKSWHGIFDYAPRILALYIAGAPQSRCDSS